MYLSYWSSALSEKEAMDLTHLLNHTLSAILDGPQQTVASLSLSLDGKFASTLDVSKEMVASDNTVLVADPTEARNLTMQEEALRKAWAVLLNLKPTSISRGQDFIRLGGDSIMAMKLAREKLEGGFYLSFQDALSHSRLSDMAARLRPGKVPKLDKLSNSWVNIAETSSSYSSSKSDDGSDSMDSLW